MTQKAMRVNGNVPDVFDPVQCRRRGGDGTDIITQALIEDQTKGIKAVVDPQGERRGGFSIDIRDGVNGNYIHRHFSQFKVGSHGMIIVDDPDLPEGLWDDDTQTYIADDKSLGREGTVKYNLGGNYASVELQTRLHGRYRNPGVKLTVGYEDDSQIAYEAVMEGWGFYDVDFIVESYTPTVTSLDVTPATGDLAPGDTQQLTATTTNSIGQTEDVTATATWSSSDAAVATVDSNGLVTAVAAGSATITATSGAFSDTFAATVATSEPLFDDGFDTLTPGTNLATNPGTAQLTNGGLTATLSPSTGTSATAAQAADSAGGTGSAVEVKRDSGVRNSSTGTSNRSFKHVSRYDLTFDNNSNGYLSVTDYELEFKSRYKQGAYVTGVDVKQTEENIFVNNLPWAKEFPIYYYSSQAFYGLDMLIKGNWSQDIGGNVNWTATIFARSLGSGFSQNFSQQVASFSTARDAFTSFKVKNDATTGLTLTVNGIDYNVDLAADGWVLGAQNTATNSPSVIVSGNTTQFINSTQPDAPATPGHTIAEGEKDSALLDDLKYKILGGVSI